MQSQFHHNTAQTQEPEPETAIHHPGEEETHEKKAKKVLKKVKEKAKKIKDTLTKHGQNDDEEYGEHIPNDHDLDEEDDANEEGDEVDQDPEVHGAPIYESEAVKDGISAQPVASRIPQEAGKPVLTREEPLRHIDTPFHTAGELPDTMNRGNGWTNKKGLQAPQKTNVSIPPGISQIRDNGQTNDTKKLPLHHHTHGPAPANVKLELPSGLEEDPAAPRERSPASNYQTKLVDPTGEDDDEISVEPIIRSLGDIKVAGSNMGTKSEQPKSSAPSSQPYEVLKPREETKSPNQSSYTQKVSSVTTTLTEKAMVAKNAVASKLGYENTNSTGGGENAGSSDNGRKIAATVTERVTPLYEKVKETGSTVMSKLPSASGGEYQSSRDRSKVPAEEDKGVSVMDYLAGKLAPSEEERALSEVIAERLRGAKQEHSRGAVKQSKEVEERLGPLKEEKQDVREKGDEKSGFVSGIGGSPMVDKVREAVGSMFGKNDSGGQTKQGSEQSLGSTQGTEGFDSSGRDLRMSEQTGGAVGGSK